MLRMWYLIIPSFDAGYSNNCFRKRRSTLEYVSRNTMLVPPAEATDKNHVPIANRLASRKVQQDESRSFLTLPCQTPEYQEYTRAAADVRVQSTSPSIFWCVPVQLGTIKTPAWRNNICLSVEDFLAGIWHRVASNNA